MTLETTPTVASLTTESLGPQNLSENKDWNFRSAFRFEWLGQTMASLCWIASVFVYGLSSLGDVLQLTAASMWLLANMAALRGCSDNRS